jgi:hypothetical protein
MNIAQPRRAPSVIATGVSLALMALIGSFVVLESRAVAAPVAIGLGTAGSFGVLAGTGITNTGPTTVAGDIGTFPTTSITGFGSMTVSGTNHAGDSVTQGAKTDLTTAYTTAAGEGPTTAIAADLVGRTLKPGVYNSASAVALSGVLTLDAAGDPSAVWVFQAASTLITASDSRVVMLNGAQPCHVYWQVGSSATLGTNSRFIGTILALTSISLQTGATVDGRVLARNGAVTLDTNTITRSACSSATVAPTTPVTATPTATVAPTTQPITQVTATPSGAVGTGDDGTG